MSTKRTRRRKHANLQSKKLSGTQPKGGQSDCGTDNPETGQCSWSSPVGTYEHLVEMYENGDLDFSQVTTVNLDEYKGLAGSDEQSYRYFMNTHLFHKININHANTYVPNGTEPDAEKACQAYNELLHKIGPADIQILGLGHDGHIGFNEPSDH